MALRCYRLGTGRCGCPNVGTTQDRVDTSPVWDASEVCTPPYLLAAKAKPRSGPPVHTATKSRGMLVLAASGARWMQSIGASCALCRGFGMGAVVRRGSVPLEEVAEEAFAQLRAEGRNISAASREVGINRDTGTRWAKGEGRVAERVQARIAYLRGASTVCLPNAAALLNTIHSQAMIAIAEGGYKAGLDALWRVYQERKEAEKAGIVTTGVPVPDDDDRAAVELLTDGEEWGDE